MVETFQECFAGKLNQVIEASSIGREHGQMVGRFALSARGLIEPAAGRYIRFVTNNRIDPHTFAGLIEFERAVQVSVVGDRQRVHAQLFRPIYEFINRARSIEQTVVAVAMQMSKWRRRHRGTLP